MIYYYLNQRWGVFQCPVKDSPYPFNKNIFIIIIIIINNVLVNNLTSPSTMLPSSTFTTTGQVSVNLKHKVLYHLPVYPTETQDFTSHINLPTETQDFTSCTK